MRASVWASSVLPVPVGPSKDIGLGELNLVHIVVKLAAHTRGFVKGGHRGAALDHAAIVVVHGNRHGALGVFLAHDIGRKLVIDLVRRRHVRDDLTVVLKLKALDLGVNSGLGRSLAVVVEETREIAVAGGVHKVRSQRLLKDLGAGGDALIADRRVVGPFNKTTNLSLLFPQKEQRMGLPFSSKLSCMLPAIFGVLRGKIARGDDTVDQAVVEGVGSGR